MATQTITPQTVSAMRRVFSLLEDNFDAVQGVYLHEWSDDRIAKDTGISVEGVKKYRVDGFGKLKPPTELYQIQKDVADLEKLALQLDNDLRAGLKDIKARILNLQRKFD